MDSRLYFLIAALVLAFIILAGTFLKKVYKKKGSMTAGGGDRLQPAPDGHGYAAGL